MICTENMRAHKITDALLNDILDKDDVHKLRDLLGAGLAVNRSDEDGRGLLHLAASFGAKDCMRELLESGAGVDAVDDCGETPLAECILSYYCEGSLACTRLLIAAGANVDFMDDNDTSLVCSTTVPGCEEHLRLLVEAGADVNLRDWGGNTALHHAVFHYNAEAVRMLLAAGADPTAENDDRSSTPRDCAKGKRAKKCRELLTEALLARGISIETETGIDVSELRRQLYRRAVVFRSIAPHEPTKEKENWLGRVTWQLPGEGRPLDSKGKPLIPLATLFINDLPFIPPALEKLALITIFAPQDPWDAYDEPLRGCIVRAYATTDGLERCNYTAAEFTPCLLIPKLVENDMPVFPDCGGSEIIWDMINKIERVQGVDYEEDIMEADYEIHKIGGYPTYEQAAPQFSEDYAFVLQICSDTRAGLNLFDCGKYYYYYNAQQNAWRVHADCY